MTKKLLVEEPTLFSWDDGSPIVSTSAPSVGQEFGTFAASCTNEAAVDNPRFRCPLEKCPQYLLKCF